MKPSTRAASGRRFMSFAAISTASRAARSEAATASACTLALNSSRGGRAQMLDLRAGRGERRSALCLGCGGGGAQSLARASASRARLGVGGVARRIRLTLRRFRVGEELRRRRPPLFDDRRNRTEQEPAQDQHQNQDVERLQPERPPVDPHRGRSLT